MSPPSNASAKARRNPGPIFDAPFYTGAVLRRVGGCRDTAQMLGTTVAEKVQCELGWVVADALMTVGNSLPPKSAAFIACFTKLNGEERQPLDAVFERMKSTLSECARILRQCTGSTRSVTQNASVTEVCETVLALVDEARGRLARGGECETQLAEVQKKVATTSRVYSSADVEKAMNDIRQREKFLEESETKLMSKVQQQQEREVELEQLAEDISFRERQLKVQLDGAPKIEKPKFDEFRE